MELFLYPLLTFWTFKTLLRVSGAGWRENWNVKVGVVRSISPLQRGETMALASLVLRAYWCRSGFRGVRCQSQSEWTSEKYGTENRQKPPFKRVTAQWSEPQLRIQGEFLKWGMMFDCLVKAWGSQPHVPNGNIFFYVQICLS